jgi:CHASE2 domain-containing sensor protein
VPATIEQREAAVVPSLSLQAVMQHMRRERGGALLAAAVDKRAGVVRVRDASRNELRTIPIVDADLDMIVAVAHSHEVQPTAYHQVVEHAADPARLSRFKDKIVVIGYGTPDDRWAVSSGDQHYGVELQASAISNILRKVYTQPARPLVQYLVILVMGAVGALLRTRAVRRARLAIPLRGSVRTRRHMEVPWAMLAVVLAYGLVVFFVYKQQRQILDISYHVAALFLVYLLIGWAQKGTLFTRMPKEA